MTALRGRLPDDVWRAHARDLGWTDAQLDRVEWHALLDSRPDAVVDIAPHQITLKRAFGLEYALAREIETAETVVAREDPWCPAHGTACSPTDRGCGRPPPPPEERCACERPRVVDLKKPRLHRSEFAPCGACWWCHYEARCARADGRPKKAKVVERDPKPENLLFAPPPPPPAKKTRHDKHAPLPGQLGLLGGTDPK
jgi:hypothetical protein